MKFQLFLIGQLTGNPVNFGIFDTFNDAIKAAEGADPAIYADPFVRPTTVLT